MWRKIEYFFKLNCVQQTLLQLIFRGSVLLLIVIGTVVYTPDKASINSLLSLLLLMLSGLLNGLNYGFHNHNFLHRDDDETSNLLHRSHIIWEHVISGIVSSLATYILITKLTSITPDKIILTNTDLILLTIVLLGYCGFIPMIMWFFSYGINSFTSFLKKTHADRT